MLRKLMIISAVWGYLTETTHSKQEEAEVLNNTKLVGFNYFIKIAVTGW